MINPYELQVLESYSSGNHRYTMSWQPGTHTIFFESLAWKSESEGEGVGTISINFYDMMPDDRVAFNNYYNLGMSDAEMRVAGF